MPLFFGYEKKSLTGVVTGIVLIVIAAMAGDFSLYMLCSCARRTGKITYVEVREKATLIRPALEKTLYLLHLLPIIHAVGKHVG